MSVPQNSRKNQVPFLTEFSCSTANNHIIAKSGKKLMLSLILRLILFFLLAAKFCCSKCNGFKSWILTMTGRQNITELPIPIISARIVASKLTLTVKPAGTIDSKNIGNNSIKKEDITTVTSEAIAPSIEI